MSRIRVVNKYQCVKCNQEFDNAHEAALHECKEEKKKKKSKK